MLRRNSRAATLVTTPSIAMSQNQGPRIADRGQGRKKAPALGRGSLREAVTARSWSGEVVPELLPRTKVFDGGSWKLEQVARSVDLGSGDEIA